MSNRRRHPLHLAALGGSALAWPGQGHAAYGERSGAADRKVVHQTFWNPRLSCDNAAVPVSQQATRIATVADFAAAPACTVMKETGEGPFFFCTNPGAAEIARGLPGSPLVVALRAVNAATCQPIADAVIDIWRCDARGLYSGQDLAEDEPIRQSNHTPPVTDARHCRGALRTDADGIAEFRSIYPGYYIERAIHIHFKVHLKDRAFLTHQALLPEAVNEAVLATAPYNRPRKGPRVPNAKEADWGMPTMRVLERGAGRVALLDVALAV